MNVIAISHLRIENPQLKDQWRRRCRALPQVRIWQEGLQAGCTTETCSSRIAPVRTWLLQVSPRPWVTGLRCCSRGSLTRFRLSLSSHEVPAIWAGWATPTEKREKRWHSCGLEIVVSKMTTAGSLRPNTSTVLTSGVRTPPLPPQRLQHLNLRATVAEPASKPTTRAMPITTMTKRYSKVGTPIQKAL